MGVAEKFPSGSHQETEIGLIPHDWVIRCIGDVCEINGRIGFRGYTVSDIVREGEGAITISPSNIKDGQMDFAGCTYLSWFKYEESPEIKVNNGDILLVKTGSTFGKTAIVRNLPQRATVNPQVVVLKKFKISGDFLGYMMGFGIIQKQIASFIVGGAIPTLSQQAVANFKLPVPQNVSEQQSIATALSDTDALISSLEKLIEKKRNIKQGAMQELLTGKRRLPGFSGKWDERSIGDLVQVDPENLQSKTPSSYKFKYISLEAIDRGILLSLQDHEFKTAPSRARRIVRRNDILIATVRPNLMSHYYVDGEVQNTICSTGFSVLRCDETGTHAPYIFQHFFADSLNRQINLLLSGSNYPAINSRDVKELVVPYPEYQEQVAIASAIQSMTQEINALVQQVAKYKSLKQGMMQNLLTGKIRLI
ncbi:restriction endonuclease subunit S [bacterium]|nr:restriction endonuclease subunit S [bacterium]